MDGGATECCMLVSHLNDSGSRLGSGHLSPCFTPTRIFVQGRFFFFNTAGGRCARGDRERESERGLCRFLACEFFSRGNRLVFVATPVWNAAGGRFTQQANEVGMATC
jgi:hypothetical protein